MTYLTSAQWSDILMRYRKFCQRIVTRDGFLTRAQWRVLDRITALNDATLLDDKPRNRAGDVAPAKKSRPIYLGESCPECLGEGVVSGRRITGRGLNAWHDAPGYEYVTCDVCNGTGLDSSE